MISVVIPVKDGGDDLCRCLDALAGQMIGDDVEIVVIDSGSSDGSAELAYQFGARVEKIRPEEFNHGATRNLGARLATGDVLVFTSQDASAADSNWLRNLVQPLRDDERVAGVYGRQLPREDAKPPERFFLDFLYGPESREQRVAGPAELSMATTLFSNANAAIRRSIWEEFRFADDIIMSEDQDWSRRVLVAGYTIRYEARAAVRHSHPYTLGKAFRRFFDSGVSAERAYLASAASSARVLRGAAFDYAARELVWLWRTDQRRWIPYAAVYELAKFGGLQLGTRHRLLPRWLKLRCTALPAHWRGALG